MPKKQTTQNNEEDLKEWLKKKYTGIYDGNTLPKVDRVKTGHIGLDLITNGGIPLGRVVEFFGSPSMGKTVTSSFIMKVFQDQGYQVAFIDAERRFDPEHAARIGLKAEDILIHRPGYGEEAIEFIKDAFNAGFKLVVVDSVPMLSPKVVEEKYENDSTSSDIAGQARMFSKHKVALTKAAELNNGCIILLNQVRANLSSPYGGTTTAGGYVLQHICSLRLNFKYSEKIKDSDGEIISHVIAEKNTIGIPNAEFELKIDRGIVNLYHSLLITGIKYEVIVRNGAFYKVNPDLVEVLGAETIGQGEKRAWAFMAEHPEFTEKLYSEIELKAKAKLNKLLNIN